MYSSKSTSEMILSRVRYKHLKYTKKVLKARGGFVEPSTLKKAAAAAAAAKSSSEAPNPDTAKRDSGKGKAQKVAKPTSDKEADAVAERSQSRKALAGLKEGANERKAEKFKAKKALAGLKEGRNESKAETHQKKKAMGALKTPRKTETGDVDPAIRAFLEGAVQEICKTQPENPLRVLAQKCRDKASEAADPAPSLQEAAEPEPEGAPVATVEEAVRRLKKYHDLGALGVKKLVQQVRGQTQISFACLELPARSFERCGVVCRSKMASRSWRPPVSKLGPRKCVQLWL
eukprot:COSAG03_NODE_2567_length_2636_cov_2.666141_2_plen_289_part_00